MNIESIISTFKKRSTIISLVIIAFFAVFAYLPTLNAFYQQDEWLAFDRLFILQSTSFIGKMVNIFSPTGGHYTPLNLVLLFGEFSLFGISYKGYILASILWHVIVSLLFFKLALLITKNKLNAFLIAVTFAVFASTFQATGWVMADLGTHFSTIFSLISLIFLFTFFETKRDKHFYFSIVILFFSLFFKEISIGIFILIPLAIFLFLPKAKSKNNIKYYLIPIITLGTFLLLRFTLGKINAASLPTPAITQSQSTSFMYNAATIPVKSFVQSIFPVQLLIKVSRLVSAHIISIFRPDIYIGTWQFDVFAEFDVLEILSFIFFSILVLILILKLKNKWNNYESKVIIFSFLFAIINAAVFVLSPERSGRISVIDSRNLYLVSVGSIIFIVTFIESFLKNKQRLFVFIISVVILFNFISLRQQLNDFVEIGKFRMEILNSIKDTYPNLPEKVIFYTESDRSYYALPSDEKILPFQSGLGQTLLVWYKDQENWPSEFYQNRFLWEIKDQGYKEASGRGYGYFRNWELLKRSIHEYNLSADSVFAFKWDSKTNSFLDITKETRTKLKNEKN
ncbi:hypothetical protein KW795_00415 [Candidatus Microgenomates bacterium]|nr:hypothetical protein [Candidatus Microgenomates bacterium]